MPRYSQKFLEEAHSHTFKNEKEISESSLVVCLYCGRLYDPGKYEPELEEERDGQKTAFCHFCPVDAVIGNASSSPITDEDYIKECGAYWFEGKEVQLNIVE